MSANCVDGLSALANTKIASLNNRSRVGSNRHEEHGRSRSHFSDRLRVDGIIFAYEELDVDKSDQAHIVSRHRNLSGPIVMPLLASIGIVMNKYKVTLTTSFGGMQLMHQLKYMLRQIDPNNANPFHLKIGIAHVLCIVVILAIWGLQLAGGWALIGFVRPLLATAIGAFSPALISLPLAPVLVLLLLPLAFL